MLGVQLETVVVDGMNSFLIIVFFVVSSQRKKIEKVYRLSLFNFYFMYKIYYTKCPIHSSRSPGRRSITGISTIV